MGSNPTWVEIIFRSLVCLAHTPHALGQVLNGRRRLVTDSSTKYAWVIHESKALQIHVHNSRRCLYVPRNVSPHAK